MSMNIDSKLNNENGFWDVSLQGELDVSTADKFITIKKYPTQYKFLQDTKTWESK